MKLEITAERATEKAITKVEEIGGSVKILNSADDFNNKEESTE